MRDKQVIFGSLSVSVLLAVWIFVTKTGLVSPYLLPSPGAVFSAAGRLNAGYLGSTLLGHLEASLYVVLTGYVAAASIGTALGILMAWNRIAELLLDPLISLLRPIPPAAWIPLAILWFGIGTAGKVFVVFAATISPCIVNSYVAIRQTSPQINDAARMLGAGNTALLFQVAIPSALPLIANGMRIALGNAWSTVVAAELVVATAGFGYVIMNGYRNFEAAVMAFGVIAVALLGFAFGLLFRQAEKLLIPWAEHE